MITYMTNVGTGQAIKILLEPTELKTRLIKNETGVFTDENSGILLGEWTDSGAYLDDAVVDGQTYYYATYSFDGHKWAPENGRSIVSQATFRPVYNDPVSCVYNRLVAGFKVERDQSRIHCADPIDVLIAPATNETSVFPIVTLRCVSDSVDRFAIGASIIVDETEALEWWGKMELRIEAISTNSVQRQELRRALRNIIQGNLGIFENYGYVALEFSQTDAEDTKTGKRTYSTVAKLNFDYVIGVEKDQDIINEITISASTN